MALQAEKLDCEKKAQLFCEMVKSRAIQEKIKAVGGRCVRDTGEEAIPIGSLYGLNDDDIITCYFRGDASNLRIRGAYSMKDLLAGWLLRKGENTPTTFAYPNSWTDVEHGVIGTTSSLIGADAVISAGVALTQKIQESGKVVLFLSGDGATSKGEFYETMNFAKLQKLPLVILIRNNNYAMSTTMDRNIAVESFTDLPALFHIPCVQIDGNDAVEVANAVAFAAEKARSGEGPFAIVAKTFRMAPHTLDDEDEYRADVDRSYWVEHDPLLIMEKHLLDLGYSEEKIAEMKKNCLDEVEAAAEWALSRPAIESDEVLAEQQSVIEKMWR